ncbi:hypothetical protein ACFP51_09225 [Streptomyces pratens]|uniref:Uncharacterized protein n=1 Tax=Streptomyces pratens TaxID=887456 RepID=A0ABW1LY50_9ACTN
MTTPADVRGVREPGLPGRLLTVERDALVPLLRGGATLVRLYAGRSVKGASYELAGAEAAELNIFGG